MPPVVEQTWLGRRIVIRHSVDRDEAGRPRFADVVGDLVALTDETATVHARNGLQHIPIARVAATKLVEPAAAEVLALEATCARGWRAHDTEERHGWLLRADVGFSGRANSALPLRQLTVPLDVALNDAREWYAVRGLPLRLQVPLPARRLLDAELATRGWTATPDTYVLASRLDMLLARTSPGPDVHIVDAPDDAWLALFRDGAMPPAARPLLTRHDRVSFAEIRCDGATVAIGRGAVDDGWLGVTAVEVTPAARRQGLATAIMHALGRWAVERHAASRSYLQVTVGNHAGLGLYRRLGYWQHHVYRYRSEP
jgi:N-acetylglutamate synthase